MKLDFVDDKSIESINDETNEKFSRLIDNITLKNGKISYSDIDRLGLDDEEKHLFLEYLNNHFGYQVVSKENSKNAKSKIKDEDTIYVMDATTQYLKEIGSVPLLSDDEFKSLFDEYTNGSFEAGQKIIEANLRLSVWVAKHFVGFGMPLLDLCHEGNFGLYKALKKYEINRGKFSTYAVWWIMQSITLSLSKQSKDIRFPRRVFENMLKYKKFLISFFADYGRYPSDEEIVDKLNISDYNFKNMKMFLSDTCSLETPIIGGDEESATLGDFIIDDNLEDFNDVAYKNMLVSWKDDALSILNPKRRNVIEKRFGLNGHSAMTLRAIGEELGVSYQNILCIEQGAIKQLKDSAVVRKIHPDYDFPDETFNERFIEKDRELCVRQMLDNMYEDDIVDALELIILEYIFGACGAPKNVNGAMKLGCLNGKSDDEKLAIINRAISKYTKYYKMQNMNNKKKLVRK